MNPQSQLYRREQSDTKEARQLRGGRRAEASRRASRAAALCWFLLLASVPALGDVTPPGCDAHCFDLHLSRDVGTVENGDTVTYTVTVFNGTFPPACQVSDVDVWFYPPGSDGQPDPAGGMLLAGGAIFNPGDSVVYPSVPVTLAVDAGVTVAAARAVCSGFLQDATPPNCVLESRQINVCVLPHTCDGIPSGCSEDRFRGNLSRVPGCAHNGDTITYTFTAFNGSFPPSCQVTDVEIWFYPPGADGKPDMDAGIPVDSGAVFNPGDSTTYPDIMATLALDPGVHLATARAFYQGLLQDATPPGIVEDCKEVTVTKLTSCIEITKQTASTLSKAGDTVVYEISVRNCGSASLYDVTIVDAVLGDLSDCYGDVLLSGETECHTFDYVVQGDDPDPLVNEVTASGIDALGLTVTDIATASVDLVHPDFMVEKACSPALVYVGDAITWTVTVTNTGDVTLSVAVEDGTAGISETVVLQPGEAETITRSRVVTPDDDWVITNTVTATATLVGVDLPNVLERMAADTCHVLPAPRIYCPVSGWYMCSSGRMYDVPVAECTVSHAGEAIPFCEAVGMWLQDPLVWYDTFLQTYCSCGCLPTDQDDCLRAFQGYWLYTFVDDVTLEIPPP